MYKNVVFCANEAAKTIKLSMKENFLASHNNFYMLGIGGVSMSALAKILHNMGKKVSGSDVSCGMYVKELNALGICADIGHPSGKLADCDALVYTDAVNPDDVQLREALENGITLIPRGKLLAEIAAEHKCTFAVAGCHGKTTCTSMLAHIFYAAGKKFTCHIGGSDNKFSNCAVFGDDYFITEACEYKKNFLYLRADIGVVLNSDADHLDCYGNRENLIEAYRTFISASSRSLCLYGDDCGRGTLSFGIDESAYYSAADIKHCGDGKYSFDFVEGGRKLCNIKLNVCGRHNVLNALAAAGAASMAGIRSGEIKTGLENFCGVGRRAEEIGKFHGARVIADYAHHPAEISATLKSASFCKGETYVIFQPHTYSRTKTLLDDFIKVLSPLRRLLIYKTFAAREYFDADGSALTLANKIKNARYADCERDIEYFLSDVGEDDIVLVLGAGDIYDIVKNFLNQNSTDIPRTSQE